MVPVEGISPKLIHRPHVLVEAFDEHYRRAQDWELDYRIRRAGHTVWFTPHLAVTYRPRRDFAALRRQFFGSGQWRRQIVDAHPGTASFRYLAAPIVTALVALGTLLGVLGTAGVLLASLQTGRGLSLRSRLLLPPVVMTMHLAWGAGFLRSIPRGTRRSGSGDPVEALGG